jgi:hypothetical protein
MSIRQARAELNKFKQAVQKLLPNGHVLFVNTDRGEAREQVAARHGLDPDAE